MSRVFLLFLYFIISTTVSGQSKTVEMSVDSSKVYFRYYFKSKNYSEQTLSDSVKIVGRRIDDNKFYLDKIVNMQVVWTKICRIELAKDSLSIISMITDSKGRTKSAQSMEPYYKSIMVD